MIGARLEHMRPGDRIVVRHDPDEPATAVVHVSTVLEFVDAFVGIVAAVRSAVGIVAILAGRKQRREQDAVGAAGGKPALR